MNIAWYPGQGLRSTEAKATARITEEAGYDSLWVMEGAHEPFMPLALAASVTESLGLRTAIAVAFARNPMVTAQLAHSLASLSGGRFDLGLGSQVRSHIVRRFSEPWGRPVHRMAEYIQALRTIWWSWEYGDPLEFEGEFWSFDLMPLNFNPGPSGQHPPRIHVAAVGPSMVEMAVKHADGLVLHPLTSARIIDEHIAPKVARRRDSDNFELSMPVMVITGSTDEALSRAREATRAQIAFYASTPSYKWVFEAYDEGGRAEALQDMARAAEWSHMARMIPDELLEEFAVQAPTGQLREALRSRFGMRLDSVGVYAPYEVDMAAPQIHLP